jgi:hypothetical protein
MLFSCLVCSSSLKMEGSCSSPKFSLIFNEMYGVKFQKTDIFNLSKINRCFCQDSNRSSPKQKSITLKLDPYASCLRSVVILFCCVWMFPLLNFCVLWSSS